jgi:hypothetical protein
MAGALGVPVATVFMRAGGQRHRDQSHEQRKRHDRN